jgi:deoxycytidine triphosphate deaminase
MITNPHQTADNRFALSDDEAAERFELYKSSDPFPSIPPALLNSADITDYVAATGMIYPFEDSSEVLKSASYRVNLLGKCIYWDEKGEKRVLQLNAGDEFELKPNSIVFITPEPTFRLPDYIALRFNLEIKHIHKGILLGTGPLVDPGFAGKLLVPLHNLTANNYTFRGGDPIIWMEFTKLSPNKRWDRVAELELKERQGVFREFPSRKSRVDVEFYLEKAVGRERKIRSSIPVAIDEARNLAIQAEGYADQARKEVRRFRNSFERKINNYRNIFTVAGIITALAVLIPLFSLIHDANTNVSDASKEIPLLRKEIQSLNERLKAAEQRIDSFNQQGPTDSAMKPPIGQPSNSIGATPNTNAGQRNANANRQ